MLSGGVPAWPTIPAWRKRITVGGVPVDAVSYDVNRDLSNVPGDSSGQSGQSAQGTLIPSLDRDVIDAAVSPWTRLDVWPPAANTPVTIEESGDDGETWIPVFTGTTQSSAGTAPYSPLNVKLVERVPRFTRTYRTDALQDTMPPSTEGGNWRRIDDHHMWHIDRAMEVAGFFTIAPRLPATKLYASLQGSLWPATGLLVDSDVPADANTGAEWGRSFRGLNATYRFQPVTQVLFRTFVPTNGSSGTSRFELKTAAGTVMAHIAVDTANRVATISQGATTVATLTGIDDALVIRGQGTTWKLTSGTQSATGTAPTTLSPVSLLGIDADALARVGAVNVAEAYGQADPSATWAPTAVMGSAAHITHLDATPLLWDVAAGSVMDDIAKATCSHWGFDEAGRAVFYPTLGLLSTGSARTLNDDTDTYDPVPWSQDLQGTATMVTANFQYPVMSRSRYPSVELWRGSGQQVDPGQAASDLIHPDGDDDWIMVDPGHGVATSGNPAGAQARLGRGTVFIGFVDLPDSGSGPDDRPATTSEYSGSLTMVDPATYRIDQSAISSVSVSPKTGSSTVWNWMPRSRQGQDGPWVRGYASTSWADGSISSSDNGTDAPVFTLDAGKWIGMHGDYIVSWLGQVLSSDRVTIQGLQIRPDPRLQVADRVDLKISVLGVTVTGLITSKQLSHDANGLSMSLTLMVLSSQVDSRTWGAVVKHYAGDTWAQQVAAESGKTWSQNTRTPIGV